MTWASRRMLKKGRTSVMHSSISSANEYVSEDVVARKSLCSISSGAAYLISAADVFVCDTLPSHPRDLWKTFAIPKSQICGSPLPMYRQLLCTGGIIGFYLVSYKHVILCAFSQ